MEKRFLILILALYLILGVTYALVTPLFEASDELWHYPMVRHLADGNPLPVQVFDPAEAGPWKQEASQPPLYYYVGAALTFWIDTSDMEQVRWLNPHVDNGIITVDGNVNLVVHDPAASRWQGTALAVTIVRLASVLMGMVTVYLTYRIAALAVPGRGEIALGAAAVNAFMPMFLFISGAVNNDNLAIPLASLALFLIIAWVVEGSTTSGRWVALGVVIGLAVLTKEGTLGLLPLALGAIFIGHWQARASEFSLRDVPQLLLLVGRDFVLLLLPVLLIAGWWYARNLRLYGDLLGWNAFIAVLGQRPQPATLAQLWDERHGFLAAYWGLFGGVNVPLPNWIYTILNGTLVAGVAGFFIYSGRVAREEIARWRAGGRGLALVGAASADSRRQQMGKHAEGWHAFSILAAAVRRRFGVIVCLLFSGAVIYGLLSWATTTWSSQGRLVFTAISALTTLLLVGLAGWLPRRPATVLVGTLASFLFVVAAAAPFLWIAPAYRAEVGPGVALPAGLEPAAADFGPYCDCASNARLRLLGYKVQPVGGSPLEPGESVDVTLAWEALAPMKRDWSVFVHLNDQILGAPLSQRDMYPAQGLRSTRLLQAGDRLVNAYRLRVPPTAVAPSTLDLVVGLYDYETQERLFTTAPDGGEEVDALRLERLELSPAAGEAPNATSVNFGDDLELVGFSLNQRRARPGEEVELTVHWRALRRLETNYTLFAQVLDEDTTRWAASDLADAGGGTAVWPVDAVQVVTMTLALRDETPPGVFPIVVGAYTQTADGGFERLQIVEAGRITMEDALALTRIRIE